MRERSLLMLVATMVLVASFALAAFADAGAPGATFPEQPGDNVVAGCLAVAEVLLAGHGTDNAVALAIVMGIYADACLE